MARRRPSRGGPPSFGAQDRLERLPEDRPEFLRRVHAWSQILRSVPGYDTASRAALGVSDFATRMATAKPVRAAGRVIQAIPGALERAGGAIEADWREWGDDPSLSGFPTYDMARQFSGGMIETGLRGPEGVMELAQTAMGRPEGGSGAERIREGWGEFVGPPETRSGVAGRVAGELAPYFTTAGLALGPASAAARAAGLPAAARLAGVPSAIAADAAIDFTTSASDRDYSLAGFAAELDPRFDGIADAAWKRAPIEAALFAVPAAGLAAAPGIMRRASGMLEGMVDAGRVPVDAADLPMHQREAIRAGGRMAVGGAAGAASGALEETPWNVGEGVVGGMAAGLASPELARRGSQAYEGLRGMGEAGHLVTPGGVEVGSHADAGTLPDGWTMRRTTDEEELALSGAAEGRWEVRNEKGQVVADEATGESAVAEAHRLHAAAQPGRGIEVPARDVMEIQDEIADLDRSYARAHDAAGGRPGGTEAMRARREGLVAELEGSQTAAEADALRQAPGDSEGRRLWRARSMGFDTQQQWYHGTGADFDRFSAHKSGGNAQEGERAVWVTDDPKVASEYADTSIEGRPGADQPNVKPLYARGTFLEVEYDGEYHPGRVNDILESARTQGYDGVDFVGMGDLGDRRGESVQRAIFSEQNVRSTAANFEKDATGDLMGADAGIAPVLGRAAVGATAGGALAPEGYELEGMAAGAAAAVSAPSVLRGMSVLGDSGHLLTPGGYFDVSRAALDLPPGGPAAARQVEYYKPPRGVPATAEKVMTPSNKKRLIDVAERGVDRGGLGWYNTHQLYDEFVGELGGDVGQERFFEFMRLIAATSPRSRVDKNLARASRYYQQGVQGQPIEQITEKGYGHLADKLHRQMIGQGEFNPTTQPKISSFVENMRGNQVPVTIDTHNAKVLGLENPPKKTEYGALAEYQQDIAEEMGMSGAQWQSSLWVGADEMTGVADSRPFLELFNEALAKTSEKLGISEKAALRGFIKGDNVLGFADPAITRAIGEAFIGGTAGGLLAPEGDEVGGIVLGALVPSAIRHIAKLDNAGRLVTPSKGSKQGLELGEWWSNTTGRPLADWTSLTKFEQDLQVKQLSRAERDLNLGGPGTVVGRGGFAMPELVGFAGRGAIGGAAGYALAEEDENRLMKGLIWGTTAALAPQLLTMKAETARKLASASKAGMLSAFSTTGMNVLSTASSAAGGMMKEGPALMWDRLIAAGLSTGQHTKGGSVTRDMLEWGTRGAQKGSDDAMQILRHGASEAELEKFDARRVEFNNPIAQAAHDSVFNFLGAQDRVFYGIVEARSIQEQARAVARQMAGEGEPIDDIIRHLTNNPTDEMVITANVDASLEVFRSHGALSDGFRSFRKFVSERLGEKAEVVLDLLVPFSTTPANVVSRVAEASPFGFLGVTRDLGELRRYLDSGQIGRRQLEGAAANFVTDHPGLKGYKSTDEAEARFLQRKIADRLGRATIGTGVMGLGMYLAHKGLMTGDYPRHDTQQAAKWRLEDQPSGAIKIGNIWVPLQRLAPFGPMLVLGAELYHKSMRGGRNPVMVAADYIGGTVSNESFLGDIDGALGIMSDRKPFEENIADAASDITGRAVPNIIRRALVGWDQTQVDRRRASLSEPGTLLDPIRERTPGLRGMMPRRITALGDVSREEDLSLGQRAWGALEYSVNPFSGRRNRKDDDELIAEISRVGAVVTVSASEELGSLQRGTHEYSEVAEEYGTEVRAMLSAVTGFGESDELDRSLRRRSREIAAEYQRADREAMRLINSDPDYEGRTPEEVTLEIQADLIDKAEAAAKSAVTNRRKAAR